MDFGPPWSSAALFAALVVIHLLVLDALAGSAFEEDACCRFIFLVAAFVDVYDFDTHVCVASSVAAPLMCLPVLLIF